MLSIRELRDQSLRGWQKKEGGRANQVLLLQKGGWVKTVEAILRGAPKGLEVVLTRDN